MGAGKPQDETEQDNAEYTAKERKQSTRPRRCLSLIGQLPSVNVECVSKLLMGIGEHPHLGWAW